MKLTTGPLPRVRPRDGTVNFNFSFPHWLPTGSEEHVELIGVQFVCIIFHVNSTPTHKLISMAFWKLIRTANSSAPPVQTLFIVYIVFNISSTSPRGPRTSSTGTCCRAGRGPRLERLYPFHVWHALLSRYYNQNLWSPVGRAYNFVQNPSQDSSVTFEFEWEPLR